jgi:hypothetical protein
MQYRKRGYPVSDSKTQPIVPIVIVSERDGMSIATCKDCGVEILRLPVSDYRDGIPWTTRHRAILCNAGKVGGHKCENHPQS